jgi:uncharacterized protein YegP (UPF0339 family)
MSGWYEISQSDNGEFAVVLKAANAQVVLRSQQYASKDTARKGIAAVQENSPQDARYELATAGDGRFYFNLKAGNHQVIGTSQMYTAEAHRNAGIASVKENGPTVDVRDAVA